MALFACIALAGVVVSSVLAEGPHLRYAKKMWGSKGAYERTKEIAEKENEAIGATTEICHNTGENKEGVTQWFCYGKYPAEGIFWQVNIDPFGKKTFFQFCSKKECK